MNLRSIKASNIEDAWFQCLNKVLTCGYEYTIARGSFVGHKRRELDYVTIEITNPKQRPLAPLVPEGVPPPTSDEYIAEYLTYLMTAEKKENEQYTYGEDLEYQMYKVLDMYKHHPETNQACMIVGSRHSIDLDDPPCLRVVDTRLRYGKLHFIVYFRSWDLWAAFPTNLGGLQLMKEFMANEIGCEDGEIIAASKGLHLYDHTWSLAKQICRLGETDGNESRF
jgi:thymidylate synthase